MHLHDEGSVRTLDNELRELPSRCSRLGARTVPQRAWGSVHLPLPPGPPPFHRAAPECVLHNKTNCKHGAFPGSESFQWTVTQEGGAALRQWTQQPSPPHTRRWPVSGGGLVGLRPQPVGFVLTPGSVRRNQILGDLIHATELVSKDKAFYLNTGMAALQWQLQS